jgi:HlyD family secretion protein
MWRALGILLVGAVIGAIAVLAYQRDWRSSSDSPESNTTPPTSNAPSQTEPSRRSVMALGTLEPGNGIVQISSPMIGFHIQKVVVEEGQSVKAGDVLIELDPTEAQAEVQLARTRLEEAQQRQEAELALASERVKSAELAVQQATSAEPLELEAHKSRLTVTELKKEQSKKDLDHAEQLRKLAEPLASQQQVEQQRVLVEAAAAEHFAAEVAGKRLTQTLAFQKQTASAELRAATQALSLAEKGTGIQSLKQAVSLAELKLAKTKISTTTGGVVLNVLAHPGEVIAQQPLMQITDLDTLVCVAEVDAADVHRLGITHPARITSPAFQDTVLEGKVARLGSVVTQASLQPLDPRKPIDRNVAKVVIFLDSQRVAQLMNKGEQERRTALIGLQVEVEFPLTAAKP